VSRESKYTSSLSCMRPGSSAAKRRSASPKLAPNVRHSQRGMIGSIGGLCVRVALALRAVNVRQLFNGTLLLPAPASKPTWLAKQPPAVCEPAVSCQTGSEGHECRLRRSDRQRPATSCRSNASSTSPGSGPWLLLRAELRVTGSPRQRAVGSTPGSSGEGLGVTYPQQAGLTICHQAPAPFAAIHRRSSSC